MAIINTGAVERTITGVNESDLFLDESNSNVTNTGAVERDIEASHDANFVHPLGDELVVNGDYSDGTNNWTPNTNATLSIENGRLKIAISGAGSGYPSQNITTVVGKKYKITADAFIGTATKVSL